jgi:hypothetical protein
MRVLFFENRQGYVDIGCMFQPPAGAPGAPLTASTRLNVVPRGKFFEQPDFAVR